MGLELGSEEQAGRRDVKEKWEEERHSRQWAFHEQRQGSQNEHTSEDGKERNGTNCGAEELNSWGEELELEVARKASVEGSGVYAALVLYICVSLPQHNRNTSIHKPPLVTLTSSYQDRGPIKS